MLKTRLMSPSTALSGAAVQIRRVVATPLVSFVEALAVHGKGNARCLGIAVSLNQYYQAFIGVAIATLIDVDVVVFPPPQPLGLPTSYCLS